MDPKGFWDILQDVSEMVPEEWQFAVKIVIGLLFVVLFVLAAIVIAVQFKKNIKELRGNDTKEEKADSTTVIQQTAPVSQVVTVQFAPPPPTEPLAEPQKPVKLLTKPPVDIVKPLYREQLVEELCQQILTAAQAGEDNKFLLSGFGGVGKTTVARALYRKLKNQCRQIGWVECRESGDLKASLLAAIYTSDENKTAEERFAEIEGILGEATGQTILFLDNVDQPDELLTELTRYDATLIVTSRLSEAVGYCSKPIPPLSEDECVELFRSYCSRTVKELDEPVVRELVRLVSCHTLSVELLAKGVPAKVGFAEYLEQLKVKGFGFPGLKFCTGHDRESRTVVEHLKKLFDMAKLDEEQTRVMQNLALMADSRTIPAEVQDWIGCDENALVELVNTGWLNQTGEGYEVHPIVREIVLLDEVPVAAVEKFFDFVTYEEYFKDGEDYRAVQLKLGIAKAVLEKMKNRLKENRDTGALYSRLGIVYNDQGEYAQAENYHEKALDINLKVLGQNHRNTAICYNNLGVVYDDQGKYAQAEECHQKALDIRRKVLGEEHPSTATSYNNLGNVYDDQGNYAQAEECHQKALDIRRKVLGEEHPDTASSYNNLGNVYSDQGEYADAEECHRKALDIKRKVLGEEHPSTANSYNSLGVDYIRQGKSGQAMKMFLKAWKIDQQKFGSEHPSTKRAIRNLRNCFPYIDHGDQDFDTWLSQQ